MEIDPEIIKEADIIDIKLKDLKGNVRTLTELKGKVVLIDFTVYNNAMSAAHNLALRELYGKYQAQGLEIYQIIDAAEYCRIRSFLHRHDKLALMEDLGP